MSELVVCTELLGMGYEVFRTVDPSGPVDLAVRTAGGEVLFIEVKTANRGKLTSRATLDSNVADILALVDLDTHNVEYQDLHTLLWGRTPLRCISQKRH